MALKIWKDLEGMGELSNLTKCTRLQCHHAGGTLTAYLKGKQSFDCPLTCFIPPWSEAEDLSSCFHPCARLIQIPV